MGTAVLRRSNKFRLVRFAPLAPRLLTPPFACGPTPGLESQSMRFLSFTPLRSGCGGRSPAKGDGLSPSVGVGFPVGPTVYLSLRTTNQERPTVTRARGSPRYRCSACTPLCTTGPTFPSLPQIQPCHDPIRDTA